ncbi:hypothetical protein EA462_15625 [Natrarchaeobius halalkaliphilus]|uniref:Pyrrolo-quinoline quinone repeat domain-containing protein n=1 Tax=Natrarchaeobius halalkaliphilus TaxID=1679091 RepID=A0A3N6LY77_9EURY|nr:PQQ-binding-like beta-propeller repeat protein [Natrarchaeobius halalkaliphilus]RQG87061.1 hypothetical protein EA462_15625 [Natrarchaeobius halalkaliphilus]
MSREGSNVGGLANRREALRVTSLSILGGLAGCMQPLLEETPDEQSADTHSTPGNGDDAGGSDDDEAPASGEDTDGDDQPDELELTEAWHDLELSHVYVSDGQFVARDSPDVYVLTRDGEVVWSTESSDPDRYSIWPMNGDGFARTDEFAFINYTSFTSEPGEYDGRIYAYDGDDGTELWMHETGLDRLRGLDATTERVYYTGTPFDDEAVPIRALSVDSREIEWERTIGTEHPYGPVLFDSTLYVSDDVLYALDPDTGEIEREHDVSGRFARRGDTLYFTGHESVQAFDLATEAVEWELTLENAIHSQIAVANGTIYAGDDMGYVSAYDADDGSERWEYRLVGSVTGSPRYDDGIVWAFDDTSTVWALDATDGTPLYRRETEAATDDPMAPLEGRVYVPEPYYTAYDVERD